MALTSPQEPPRGLFQRSPESRLLEQHLVTLQPGEFTYEELASTADLPQIDGSTTALTTARRALQRERGVVIACINGVGVKRLTDEEIVEAGDKAVGSIRRKPRRTIDKLNAGAFHGGKHEQEK